LNKAAPTLRRIDVPANMAAGIRIIALVLVGCCSLPAVAQQKSAPKDDLDVTMQIIVDPNAKLPEEVVRRIPLPASRTAASNANASKSSDTKTETGKVRDDDKKNDGGSKGVERAQESRELGREAADNARERAREAQQQREEARNANDKDRDKDKDRGPPDRPQPDRPPRPPRP
jgi:hypothetical protein